MRACDLMATTGSTNGSKIGGPINFCWPTQPDTNFTKIA